MMGIAILLFGFIFPLALFQNGLGAVISSFIMFLLLENVQRKKLGWSVLLKVGSYFKFSGLLMVSLSILFYTIKPLWETVFLFSFGLTVYYVALLTQLDREMRRSRKTISQAMLEKEGCDETRI